MDTLGTVRKSKKEQRRDAELGLIIEKMERAMWNANKEYLATRISVLPLTENMRCILAEFQEHCIKHYGKA